MASRAILFEQQRSARPLFVATVFAGSFLLFLMQPMVARMALPRLGGAPAVWNSAMLVYQALLLAGYAYAHFAGRLRPAKQGLVHLGLFVIAALWLPLGLATTTPPADASPIVWVPWLLIGSIGPLFFVVSAQAPLMQRWYALKEPGTNPYALYVASNLGSFGGLIAYPLLLEPFLPLDAQSMAWTIAYVLLALLVAACVLLLPRQAEAEAVAKPADEPAPSLRTRLHWIALAAVPSGLILAATTHITTDILAIPLIWVVPLGLYLLSFSFAFTDNSRVTAIVTRLFPLVLIVAGSAAGSGIVANLWMLIIGDLLIVFAAAVTLHHHMYRLRPGPARLTDFYLCMSIGGVVGGLFCALLAPAVFDWLYEYPLLIVAAGLLMPLRPDAAPLSARKIRFILVALPLLAMYARGLFVEQPPVALAAAALMAIALLARYSIGNRLVFAVCLAWLILGLGAGANLARSIADDSRTRSYFGIYTIGENSDGGMPSRILVHGNTTHGIQLLDPVLAYHPTSYYAPSSGIGIAMRAAGPKARIGVVGLGAGTLACYARPGQTWRFYEIDPVVAQIARNPKDFTFLSHCLPNVPIEIGDARLTLAAGPPARHDILAIDAFSSDAIPMHLLTREAFATYRRAMTPDGLLMVHISNKWVDLEPALAALAAADGWQVMVREYHPSAGPAQRRAAPSYWVAMSRSAATIDRLRAGPLAAGWRPIARRDGIAAWTDHHGSLLPLLKIF